VRVSGFFRIPRLVEDGTSTWISGLDEGVGVRARKAVNSQSNVIKMRRDKLRSLHDHLSKLADVLYLPRDCEGRTGLATAGIEGITRNCSSTSRERLPTFGGDCDDEGLVYLALVARSVDVEDFKLHVSWLLLSSSSGGYKQS